MAYAKATLNDLLLSFSYRYGESSIPSSGTENRKYWINRGIDYCVDQLKLDGVDTITVASGIADLNSTASGQTKDFKSFVRLLDSTGNQYTLVRPEQYPSMDGFVCCITGNHATGYTLNVKTDGTYTLYYEFYVAPLVNTTDECIIPDPEAVVAYAYAQIRMSETDPLQDAEKNLKECDMRVKNMAQAISKNEGDLYFKSLY